jgi:hypothetical protein
MKHEGRNTKRKMSTWLENFQGKEKNEITESGVSLQNWDVEENKTNSHK